MSVSLCQKIIIKKTLMVGEEKLVCDWGSCVLVFFSRNYDFALTMSYSVLLSALLIFLLQ
jgi:hypothetical protein